MTATLELRAQWAPDSGLGVGCARCAGLVLGCVVLGVVQAYPEATLAILLAACSLSVAGCFVAHRRSAASSTPRSLHVPPGTALGALLGKVFGGKVYEQLLEPHIADHALEWQEAVARDQWWLVRWIRVRCWILLLWSVLSLGRVADGAATRGPSGLLLCWAALWWLRTCW